MSLEAFWKNVRGAYSRLEYDPGMDRPAPTRARILADLGLDDAWFRKSTVAGFSIDDFGFLGEFERTRLAERVEQFKNAAPRAPGLQPNSREALDLAAETLADIIEVLDFGRYADAEALRLGKLIEGELASSPLEGVAEIRFQTGLDHTGDAMIRIVVFIDSGHSQTDEQFLKQADSTRSIVDSVANDIAPDRWPYYRMLSIDDLSPLVGAGGPAGMPEERP
ncbi:MAG: hypothetical protein SFX72_10300 [Isosphaeraceae bacterium]|nr:hypothetical protein [Isosphaeraceae bacterium]